MSQVRKFQGGGSTTTSTPEEQKKKYPKLYIDSTEIEMDDDAMQALDSYFRTFDPKYRQFFGDITNTLRSGKDVSINTHTNNISGIDKFSALNERQNQRAFKDPGRNRAGKFFDALTDSPINQLAEAIYYAGGFRYNKDAAKSNPVELNKYRNEENMFDWDKNGDTYVYSSNPKNNFLEKRLYNYLDYLKDRDAWKKANEWSDKITDEDILVDWYTRNGQDAAKQSIDALLGRIRKSSGWNSLSESDQELLSYFNIRPSKKDTADDTTPTIHSNRDKEGTYDPNARSSTGSYVIYRGNPKENPNEVEGAYYINAPFNDWYVANKPYLITEGDWSTFGLNGEYEPLRNSILYNGRFYTQDDLAKLPDSDLAHIMANVQSLNNRSDISSSDRWQQLSDLISWRNQSKEQGYYGYDRENSYVSNRTLRNLLNDDERLKEMNNLDFFDASLRWGQKPGSLLGFYDYSHPGESPWGFRNPYFVSFDENGNGRVLTYDEIRNDSNFVYDPYTPYSSLQEGDFFSGWYPNLIDDKRYGIYRKVKNANAQDEPFDLLEDPETKKLYFLNGRGKLIPISQELLEYINKGNPITRAQAESGRLNPQSTGKQILDYLSTANPAYPLIHRWLSPKEETPQYKDGGTVRKLQAGDWVPKYISAEEQTANNPLQHAGYIHRGGENENKFDFSALSEADKQDLYAAALDLSGAIVGLIPGGSTVGAGLGFTSSNLMLDADRKRGAFKKGDGSGARAIGNYVFATLLDAASIIPYVGEGPKMIKIAKAVGKIGKFAAPILNSAGLTAAAKSIMKDPHTWNSEDVIAVSAGLQALLNTGRLVHSGRGEQRLASQISETLKNNKVAAAQEIAHTFKLKTTASAKEATDIKLSNEEVRTIIDAKDKAGSTLVDILKNNHNIEGDAIPTDTKKLLHNFGFRLTEKNGQLVSVSEKTPSQLANIKEKGKAWVEDRKNSYSKAGYLADLINPFHANRRQKFIDANIKNPEVQKALTNSIYTRRISDTKLGIGEESPASGIGSRSYRTALGSAYARADMPHIEEIRGFGEPRYSILPEIDVVTKRSYTAPKTIITPEATSRGLMVLEGARTTGEPMPRIIPNPTTQETPIMIPNGLKRRYVSPRVNIPQSTPEEFSSVMNSRNSGNPYPGIQPISHLQEQPLRLSFDPASAALRQYNPTGNYIDPSRIKLTSSENVSTTEVKTNKKTANQRRAKEKIAKKQSEKLAKDAKLISAMMKSNNPMDVLRKEKTSFKDFAEFLNAHKDELREAGIILNKKGGIISADNGSSTTGWNVNNPSGLIKYLPQVLSEIGYLKTNKYQNDYLTKKLEAAEAARVHSTAPTLNGIRTTNPALERVKEEINDERTRGSRTPVTNDAITNYAIKKDTDAQLLNRENQINTQLSQDYTAKEQYNNEIQNKNILAATQTANENKKVDAAVDSAKKNEEAANIIRKDQSSQNRRLEWQNLIQQDLDRAKTYATNLEQERITKQFDDDLYNLFNNGKSSTGENLKALWSKLPYDERLQYTDFADWISKKHTDIYDASVYEDYLTRRNDALKRAAYKYALTIPAIGRAYISSPVPTLNKKGGRLNGKTRYTLEPDERIWVDNNKAAHAAIAKLNDNTIKLILRALK